MVEAVFVLHGRCSPCKYQTQERMASNSAEASRRGSESTIFLFFLYSAAISLPVLCAGVQGKEKHGRAVNSS